MDERMNANIETISVNGKTYYSESKGQEFSGDWKIIVLQRGWVIVGKLERDGDHCKVHNASVLRNWGTTKGLGEIAKAGPTSSTKVDSCNGLVEFHYLTSVMTISCNEEKWKNA